MDAGNNAIAAASFAIVVLVAAAASSLAAAVPAVYVLGDSLADVGNNNHLLTLLKADFPHNGIDYPGGKATGRFSNGKNFPDFLGALSSQAPRVFWMNDSTILQSACLPHASRVRASSLMAHACMQIHGLITIILCIIAFHWWPISFFYA